MRVTLCFLIAAPLTVVLCLARWHDVWATFGCYHLGICLVAPAGYALLAEGRSWRRHLVDLGLVVPRPGPGIAAGLGCGLVMCAGCVGGFVLLRELYPDFFPDHRRLTVILGDWGVNPDRFVWLILFMVLCNGVAEELFWRGFIHHRLRETTPRARTLLLTTLAYTGYHTLTIGLLFQGWAVVMGLTLLVLVAGLFWAWLRERFGSVWPALLSHAGATLGYMTICYLILN
ncbi:MAG: CPBP family intramembrane glutamic endopeptidase [bacterium]